MAKTETDGVTAIERAVTEKQRENDKVTTELAALAEKARAAAGSVTVHNHPYHTLPEATRAEQQRRFEEADEPTITATGPAGDSPVTGTSKESVKAQIEASDSQTAYEDITGDTSPRQFADKGGDAAKLREKEVARQRDAGVV